jgi:DNA-binding MarR family transcriptional regulator
MRCCWRERWLIVRGRCIASSSSTGAPVQAHRALACIADEPGIQSSQLAQAMGMQRSAVSHLLKSLSVHGWVERRREGDDQRSVHLYVTAAGRGIVGATAGRIVGVLQRAVQQLDDGQLIELDRSLNALLRHVEAPAPGMSGLPKSNERGSGR